MSQLPPVVMQLRADAAQFITEQGKAANAAKKAAAETAEAAAKAAAASKTASAQAKQATDTRIVAEQRAATEAKKAADMQASATGTMTKQQQVAYAQQAAAAERAANAVELASARETQAHQKAATAQTVATTAQEKATTSAEKATSTVGRLSATVQGHSESWAKLGTSSLAFGAAIVLGVGAAVKAYADFDKQMSSVKSATHASGSEMDQFRALAIQAGADTAYSAKEAAQGIEELSKAGVSSADILGGGLAGSLALAAAGSLGVGDSAELAATALTQFKLSGDKVPHLADLLSAAAGKAQGSVGDLGMALKQGGLVAASTGLTIEETTGGLAAFASAGLLGSDAGTSFKTMLMALTPNSAAAASEMNKLGIHAYDSQGKFVGLAKFSGNLKDSLKDLTDEQRNASLKIIFGSDAVRAANILYQQGAEGIEQWTTAVNQTGYAAETAAMKQDNLSGDIEKLGGSIDSVFLKSGSGANEVLRGLVKGAGDLVNAIGEVDPKILQMSLNIGAVVGVVAILGGGFMTLAPKIMDSRKAMQDLSETGSKVPGTLGKITKAAGIAAAALVGLQTVATLFSDKQTTSVEAYGQAILKVATNSKQVDPKALDSVFQGWDKMFNTNTVSDVNSMSDAVGKLMNHDWQSNVNQFFDGFTGMLNAPKSELGQIEERIKGLGDQMGSLASNGGAEAAAKSFRALSDEYVRNKKTQTDALEAVPGYKKALQGLANEAGQTLTDQELLNYALGIIPDSMKKAATATSTYRSATGEAVPLTEEMSKQLEKLGINAQGVVTDLGKFTDALFAAGLLSLNSSDAAINYQKGLEAVDASLKKNGNTLDIHTEKGKENQGVLNALARDGISYVETLAKETDATGKHTYSNEQLQGSLRVTFDDLKANADNFALVGETADDAARRMMGIPKNVNIDTWMSDAAKRMAEQTTGAAGNIPKDIPITVHIFGQQAIQDAWNAVDALKAHAADASQAILHVNSMQEANRYANGNAYSSPGGYTGGAVDSIMGFAGGGMIPGTPPSAPNVDNILAMVNGRPLKVRSGEFINNEPSTKANLPWLKASNAGLNIGQEMQSRFAAGYATAQAQPAMAGPAPTNPSVTIYAQTNASASHIASEVGWALRTK